MPYSVACRVPNGLDIGGFVLRGNYVGVAHTADAAAGRSNALAANAPGRERIAGYEITRDVPDAIWERWSARAQFEASGTVFGTKSEQELSEWCWRHVRGHGHAHGAPQDGSTSSPINPNNRA